MERAELDASDWLELCRRIAGDARSALARLPEIGQRSEWIGRGEGGDMTLAIDRAAEDVVFAELEALGTGLVAISEERGRVELAGGGPLRVVIDPLDGSLNAKRRLPFYSVSIAVAEGETMADVGFGYVANLASGEEWWAERGAGACFGGARLEPAGDDARLEILGVESSDPRLVAAAAAALEQTGAHRLRTLGSIALSLCYVACARFDGLVSLRPTRSVDAAAGQLIVREAGGAVAFPDTAGGPLAAPLDLGMRSRVVAAATDAIAGGLLGVGAP